VTLNPWTEVYIDPALQKHVSPDSEVLRPPLWLELQPAYCFRYGESIKIAESKVESDNDR
jgi:hypothetical protein